MQIYRIWNKENDKSYIGKTKWDVKKRYHGGDWWKWTHSVHLKRAVERYGLDAFEIQILNDTAQTEDEALELEKRYIEEYDSYIPNGYNLTRGGGTVNPSFVKEYDLIDRSGNEYHVRNLSAFCRKNRLNYNAMLSMVAGINQSSQGYGLLKNGTQLILEPRAKQWELEHIETGETALILYRGLKKWCRERALTFSGISRMTQRKTLVSQGWKLCGTVVPANYGKQTKYEGVHLISPTGEEVVVDNIYRFSQENDIERGRLYDLVKERAFSVNGWTLKERKSDKCKMDSSNRSWDIIDTKTNTIHTVKNISRFCRDHGLNIDTFFAVIDGRTPWHRGYALAETDLTGYRPIRKIECIKVRHEDGRELEASTPRLLERDHHICSAQMFYDILSGKFPNRAKGWSIVSVRYVDDNYPPLMLTPNQMVTPQPSVLS